MQKPELTIVLSDDDSDPEDSKSQPRQRQKARKKKEGVSQSSGAVSKQSSVTRSCSALRSVPRGRRKALNVSLLSESPTRVQNSRSSQVVDLTSSPDDEVLVVSYNTPRARSRQQSRPGRSPQKASLPKGLGKCGICFEQMDDKMACGPCGHVFCEACLRAAIKTQRKCPTCRRSIQARQIHRIYIDKD